MSAVDEARAEALRRYGESDPLGIEGTDPREECFIAGAEWQASSDVAKLADRLEAVRDYAQKLSDGYRWLPPDPRFDVAEHLLGILGGGAK